MRFSLPSYPSINTYVPWFFAFISACDQEAGNKDDDRRVDKAAAGAIAVQDEDPGRKKYLSIDFSFADIENLTFFFEVIVRSADINIKLERPKDLVLIDSDILSQFLHLLFVEGLGSISSVIHDVVKAIAECLQSTIDILELGCQEKAGSKDQESIEVDVRFLMEEDSGDMQCQGGY